MLLALILKYLAKLQGQPLYQLQKKKLLWGGGYNICHLTIVFEEGYKFSFNESNGIPSAKNNRIVDRCVVPSASSDGFWKVTNGRFNSEWIQGPD